MIVGGIVQFFFSTLWWLSLELCVFGVVYSDCRWNCAVF